MLKKHVQFPEDFKCFEEEEEVLCMTDSNGNGTEPVDSPPSMYTLNFGHFRKKKHKLIIYPFNYSFALEVNILVSII